MQTPTLASRLIYPLALVVGLFAPFQADASNKSAAAPAKTTVQQKAMTEKVLKAKGTIRDAEAPQEGPLFHIEYEHTEKNGIAHSTLIRQTDLAGKVLVNEDTRYDEQGRLKKYSLEQLQQNIRATVEIISGKVFLSWTEDGKTKTANETASDNTVAAGSLMAFMSPQIAHLTRGNTLDIRLAVPERATVFGFTLVPQKQGCAVEPQDFCVDLSMSNFFLQKLVKPVRMTFQKSTDGYRPLSLVTPAVVRKKKGNTFEKFTALIEYPRL